MTWHLTRDLAEFETAAGPFLRSRPAEHTVLVSLVERLRAKPDLYSDSPARYGWWSDPPGAAPAAALLQTPPHPVLLTDHPEAGAALPAGFAAAGLDLSAVNSPDATAARLAAVHRERTGRPAAPIDRHRLYRLVDLTPRHPGPPGAPRTAGEADRALVLRWFAAFAAATGQGGTARSSAARVDAHLADGTLVLWEVDGEPVSLAGRTPPYAGVARIAPVYTPPALERHGYGGAATAAAARAAREAGAAEVVLFADLANPVSNSLYTGLGFVPVHDRTVLDLQ